MSGGESRTQPIAYYMQVVSLLYRKEPSEGAELYGNRFYDAPNSQLIREDTFDSQVIKSSMVSCPWLIYIANPKSWVTYKAEPSFL